VDSGREQQSLLSLYALVLSCIEALHLVQWLSNLHNGTAEAVVDWKKLNGFTLAQLVRKRWKEMRRVGDSGGREEVGEKRF
jgi:hypothetical protein